jgi:hypothetical protein
MCVLPRLSSMAPAKAAKKIDFLTRIGSRFDLLARQNVVLALRSTPIYQFLEPCQNRCFLRLEGKKPASGFGKPYRRLHGP